MEGGEEENTYPNKAWLPASGVQRGSLYTMPGSGDPQTPGIAALTGMYRRPHNESELPPIPAHPMGYGDAIKFLQEMSGNRLGKKYMKFPNINHAHALSSACVLVFNRVLAHVLKYTSSHAIALLCNFSETQSNRSYFFSPSWTIFLFYNLSKRMFWELAGSVTQDWKIFLKTKSWLSKKGSSLIQPNRTLNNLKSSMNITKTVIFFAKLLIGLLINTEAEI